MSKVQTKADLEAQIEGLNKVVEQMKRIDLRLRREIARSIGPSYLPTVEIRSTGLVGHGYSQKDTEERIPTWEEILIWIGELKADANYSMVLDAREEWRQKYERSVELLNVMEKTLARYRVGDDEPETGLKRFLEQRGE